MLFARTFYRSTALIAVTLLLSGLLTSCPPEVIQDGTLSVLLMAEDTAEADAKGVSALPREDIVALSVTVDEVALIAAAGPARRITSGPVTVDLLELTGVSRLISEVTAPEGTFRAVELRISAAELTLSSDPLNPRALDLLNGGIVEVPFSLTVAPESIGRLILGFAGTGVYQVDGGGYAFDPAFSVDLRTAVSDARVEGRVIALDATEGSFALRAEQNTYQVDTSDALVFLVGDLDMATGSASDLANRQQVAVQGSLQIDGRIAANQIEILDVPGTEQDDQGDRIAVCHFHPGDPATAYPIVVGRAVLQEHLDHGDFVGPCDEGAAFTLTYLAGAGGSILGDTPQAVSPGTNGTPVSAVADDGFLFVDWSDGRLENPRTDTAVGADLTVTANFTALYTLEYSAEEGGTISGPSTQQVVAGASGTPVTAVRNAGFVFSKWSDDRTDNPRTDTGITADLAVSAQFVRLYTLDYTAGEGGFLEGETSQQVVAGQDGSAVTAVPAPDFAFVDWSDGITENPRTDVAVSDDLSVTANFLPTFSLAYTAGENGALEGSTAQTVTMGFDGTPVTAVPAEGFGFVQWSDGRTDNPRTDTEVEADLAVSAEFAAAITLNYAAEANGSLEGAVEQVIGVGGTGTAVTAVANDGFAFLEWSDRRADNPRIDRGVTEDLSVTARFGVAYALSYSAGENGTLQGSTEQVVIAGRHASPVTAVADEGFAFVNWSDGSEANPRRDLNVQEDLAVTANFAPVFTLTYTAGENGRLSGRSVQVVVTGRDGTAVRAVPDTGFVFVEWSDGRTENPRVDTAVSEDLSVSALFEAGVILEYLAGDGGTIDGTSVQIIDVGGTGTSVTAVPAEGFEFRDWSDGRTDNPRVDSGVTANLTVTARFQMIEEEPAE